MSRKRKRKRGKVKFCQNLINFVFYTEFIKF
jgi:hypothetical protein